LHFGEQRAKANSTFLLAEVPVQPAIFIIRRLGSLFQQVNPLFVGLQ